LPLKAGEKYSMAIMRGLRAAETTKEEKGTGQWSTSPVAGSVHPGNRPHRRCKLPAKWIQARLPAPAIKTPDCHKVRVKIGRGPGYPCPASVFSRAVIPAGRGTAQHRELAPTNWQPQKRRR